MPTPSKKTPWLIQRIRELHAAGASAASIEVELKLGHGTVANWLRHMGLTPNGGGKRKAR